MEEGFCQGLCKVEVLLNPVAFQLCNALNILCIGATYYSIVRNDFNNHKHMERCFKG